MEINGWSPEIKALHLSHNKLYLLSSCLCFFLVFKGDLLARRSRSAFFDWFINCRCTFLMRFNLLSVSHCCFI